MEELAEEAETPEDGIRRKDLDGDVEDTEDGIMNPSNDLKRAYMLVYGIWSPRMACLFDICVTDGNQPSDWK